MTAVREFTRVQGFVFAWERGQRGRLPPLGLRTRQGDEYLVLATPIADFLRGFLNSEVLASVEFVSEDVGRPRIRVYGFEPLARKD